MTWRFFLVRGLASLAMALEIVPLSAPADEPGAAKPPEAPLLRPAPDDSQWIVTFAYPEDKPTPIDASAPGKTDRINRSPRTIVTTKTGAMIREQITDVLGRSSENWYLPGLEYRHPAGDPIWYQDRPDGQDSLFTPPPAGGFRDFDGVTPASFAGEIKYQGRDCLIFIPGGNGGTKITQESELESLDRVLIVDAQTRLPVEARANGIVRTFQFREPPSGKLTLPDDLQAQLAKAEKERQRLLRRPERPY